MATSSNLHEEQAGAQLHVPGYFQSSDPGAVGAGKQWADTTTATLGYVVIKTRNAADTAWLTDGAGGPTAWTVISPTALAANTNNWAPTALATAVGIRASASAAVDLTGLTGGVSGRPIFLANVGTFTITLKNNATSTAANRFLFDGDLALAANQGIWIIYDGTTSRWRLYGWGTTATGGGGSGTVTSVAQTVPAEFAVAGSPVTSTGTLAITKATQVANTIWSGPTSGADAQPAFRVLVPADIPGYITQNNQTGLTYALLLTDAGKCLEMNNAAAVTVTIPTNASVAFPIGTILEIYQQGAGKVTITPAGGVTLRAPNGDKTALQFSTVALRKRAIDEWVLAGDTSA